MYSHHYNGGNVHFDMNKNQILAAGDQYHIKFWDMDNASLLDICNAEGGLPCTPLINFNIEGNLLAVSTNDNRIKILATSDGMKLLHTVHDLGASRIAANSVAKVTKITEGLAMKAFAHIHHSLFFHFYYHFQFAQLSPDSASGFLDSLLNFAVLEFLLSIKECYNCGCRNVIYTRRIVFITSNRLSMCFMIMAGEFFRSALSNATAQQREVGSVQSGESLETPLLEEQVQMFPVLQKYFPYFFLCRFCSLCWEKMLIQSLPLLLTYGVWAAQLLIWHNRSGCWRETKYAIFSGNSGQKDFLQ